MMYIHVNTFSFLQMTEKWHTDSDNIQETDSTHYCHSVPIPHRFTGTPCQLWENKIPHSAISS